MEYPSVEAENLGMTFKGGFVLCELREEGFRVGVGAASIKVGRLCRSKSAARQMAVAQCLLSR